MKKRLVLVMFTAAAALNVSQFVSTTIQYAVGLRIGLGPAELDGLRWWMDVDALLCALAFLLAINAARAPVKPPDDSRTVPSEQ